MYWVIHNGVVVEAVRSAKEANEYAMAISLRHKHTRAIIRYMPVVSM